MLGKENELNDVAIYWPKRSSRIEKIRRSGKLPSHAVPRRVRRNALVALVAEDGRAQYGETRLIGVSYIGSDVCVLVFTKRGTRIRVISLRRANARERKRYAKAQE